MNKTNKKTLTATATTTATAAIVALLVLLMPNSAQAQAAQMHIEWAGGDHFRVFFNPDGQTPRDLSSNPSAPTIWTAIASLGIALYSSSQPPYIVFDFASATVTANQWTVIDLDGAGTGGDFNLANLSDAKFTPVLNVDQYMINTSRVACYFNGWPLPTFADGNFPLVTVGAMWLWPPEIMSQPVSQTVNVGGTITLSVVAGAGNNVPFIFYQWKKDGTAISGANSAAYTVNNAQTSHAGNYVCEVNNGLLTTISAVAAITIGNSGPVAPIITTQPVSQTVGIGGTATFSITASGTAPLYYQWKKDGANISGANSASYTISNAQVANIGSYACAVSNSVGAVVSNAAMLMVSDSGQATLVVQHQQSKLMASWSLNGLSASQAFYGAVSPVLIQVKSWNAENANSEGCEIINVPFRNSGNLEIPTSTVMLSLGAVGTDGFPCPWTGWSVVFDSQAAALQDNVLVMPNNVQMPALSVPFFTDVAATPTQ